MEFVSSTVHLLSVLGKEHLLKNADSRNPRDSYPVWSALNGLKNDLYASLGKDEYKNGTWPATEELMNAMRAWLAEFQEDFVAQEVALVLVRCGCRAETTIDSLNPWFKQLFHLSKMEFTAESVFENLRSANIFGEPSEEGLVELDRALVDPGLAVEWFYPGKFVQLILRDRIFEVALSSQCEDPDYEKLFNEMAGQAGLSDLVSDVTQSYDSEGNWFLSYTLAGGAMRFKICNMDEFSGLCDRPVISHFNELLSVRGMPIRAFRFGGETGDDPMFGSYIVADSSRFVAVCLDLAIPFIEYKD